MRRYDWVWWPWEQLQKTLLHKCAANSHSTTLVFLEDGSKWWTLNLLFTSQLWLLKLNTLIHKYVPAESTLYVWNYLFERERAKGWCLAKVHPHSNSNTGSLNLQPACCVVTFLRCLCCQIHYVVFLSFIIYFFVFFFYFEVGRFFSYITVCWVLRATIWKRQKTQHGICFLITNHLIIIMMRKWQPSQKPEHESWLAL